MPIITTNPVQLTPTQLSGGNVKNLVNNVRYGSTRLSHLVGVEHVRLLMSLFASLSGALLDAQSQLTAVENALNNDLPLANPLQIVDGGGKLVAAIGDIIDPSNNKSYTGIWMANYWFGGTGPSTGSSAILTQGSWTALTLGTGVAAFAGAYTPAANIVASAGATSMCALSGVVSFTWPLAGNVATMPSAAFRPAKKVAMSVCVDDTTLTQTFAGQLTVDTSGNVQLTASGPAGGDAIVLGLDGLVLRIV